MQSPKVLIFVESRYKVDRKRIKKTIALVLEENEVQTPVEVSVAFIGNRKMRALNLKYRGKDKTANVLEFPISDGPQMVMPEQDVKPLGDIVISYPELIRESAEQDMLVDDRVDELIQHGMLHLLGMHHN